MLYTGKSISNKLFIFVIFIVIVISYTCVSGVQRAFEEKHGVNSDMKHMTNTVLVTEAESKGELVYLENSNYKFRCVYILTNGVISSDAMALLVEEYPHANEKVNIYQSCRLLVDDICNEYLNVFQSSVIPYEMIEKSLAVCFCHLLNLDPTWKIEKFGYVLIEAADKPWRWGCTFSKNGEMRNYVYENGEWNLRNEINRYYFNSYAQFIEE